MFGERVGAIGSGFVRDVARFLLIFTSKSSVAVVCHDSSNKAALVDDIRCIGRGCGRLRAMQAKWRNKVGFHFPFFVLCL